MESIEGAETLKSGQGGWRQLSIWQNLSDAARSEEFRLKNISDSAQHSIQAFQQMAYIGMVAAGALMISRGELSMGSLNAGERVAILYLLRKMIDSDENPG